jgi:hypothetical protein
MTTHLHVLRDIVQNADAMRDGLKYREGIDEDLLDEGRNDRTLERLLMSARWMDLQNASRVLGIDPEDQHVRPPGHTCPAIDRAQSALRRLAWRCANPNHYGVTPAEVLAEGLAALELVRSENRQMREAYHAKVKP